MVLYPYKQNQTWFFDDLPKKIIREPFVGNTNNIFDSFVSHLEDPKKGFQLFFSAEKFPDYQKSFTKVGKQYDGTVYSDDETQQQGWLCSTLLKYFKKAPKNIYLKVEAL
jgi:deoxyadenosine/deoxycytidine kinase